MNTLPLTRLSSYSYFFLLAVSFLIVGFGQPAWSNEAAFLTCICGLGLFFRAVIDEKSRKKKFFVALFWFSAVQLIQLSWLISHPYGYIYGLYLMLAAGMGIQFGIIAALLDRNVLTSWRSCLGLAGLFTLFEWFRLFILCGFSFNPLGLAMTSSLWGLQGASLFGVYGLSFWLLIVNLAFLKALVSPTFKIKGYAIALWLILAAMPLTFGAIHLRFHRKAMLQESALPTKQLQTLLVQTAFPVEESISFPSLKAATAYVMEEWKEILKTVAPYYGKPVDLIALPEYVVPFGTYVALYPYDNVRRQFINLFGKEALAAMPALAPPLAIEVNGVWQVTNAYYCQALANLFNSDLVAGLQDDQFMGEEESRSYSAAFYFWSGGESGLRYEKRVLLPMAEYIPFEFCKDIAKTYGIGGSFTCGTEAKVFPGGKVPFGMSICYEETYGDIMREARVKGAELLINLSSDVWYPDSKLPQQHFDHALLRTVESGIPLVRACNTGVTAAIDSLGQVTASLGSHAEWERKALYATVPLYHYRTLYSRFGDAPIILISIVFVLVAFWNQRLKRI